MNIVYSAEEALAETRVQKPKCCFNSSERNYNYIYIHIYIYIYTYIHIYIYIYVYIPCVQ